jgi:hypothetical protein
MDNANAVIGVIPMRYDTGTDLLVPVTQDWVNETQKAVQDLGGALETLRGIVKLHPKDIRKFRIT